MPSVEILVEASLGQWAAAVADLAGVHCWAGSEDAVEAQAPVSDGEPWVDGLEHTLGAAGPTAVEPWPVGPEFAHKVRVQADADA